MKALTSALTVLALVVLLRSAISAAAGEDPRPSPALGPAEVVELQLAALARNDDPAPDAGIAIAWRFASPANRAATGPLDRFARMVKGETYGDMLDHRSAEILPVIENPAHTMVPVRLVTRAGGTARYVFVLTEQRSGEYRGCWMTDAVMPVKAEDDAVRI